ncbi:MAG: Nramp family divalent metal transporter [Chloroflexi bacterium]|jgi:Mn2+/Fe2+ NRAMP family transporter|nr:Nramp family divalent metal transporter [Chloroflexota bacterium]
MTFWQRIGRVLRRALFFVSVLGPGLITASADNDAPGIATYSVAGSRFGYSFLWILVWITLGEVVVQETAARMGAVTGKGLTDLIRERFGLRLTFLVMLGLIAANLGTTAAQFAGVASSVELFGVSRYIAVPLAAGAVWFLVTRGSYKRVEKVLLVLSLYAVAYIASAILVRPPWGEVLRMALIPTIHPSADYLLSVLATVGTTITPWAAVYLQASIADKGVQMRDYASARLDVVFGASVGNIVSAFIIISTAATLYVRGIVVESAAEAAQALVPVAGPWAEVLFGVGLLGASLLAASVLPLATTYAVCEVFGWERGLNQRPEEAPIFYGLYTALIVLSSVIVLIPGLPLFPLMWLSQVANAVLLPLVLVLMLRLANSADVMKQWGNGRFANILIVVLAVLVGLATLALFAGLG